MAGEGKPTNEPLNYIAFGPQTAKDVETTSWYFLKHLDGSGFDPDPDIQSEREGGDGQEFGLRYKQKISVGGAMNANSRPEIVGRMIAGVLGADVASHIGAGLTIHTQTPAASVRYYTFEQRSADLLERVSNCKFTSVSIEGESGGPIKVSANVMSGGTYTSRDVASALTIVRESLPPHYFPGGTYNIDGLGSYAVQVTKWKADLKRNLDDVQTNALTPEDLIELTAEYDVDVTVKYVDKNLYSKVHTSGGSVIPVPLATGSFDIYVRHETGGGVLGSYPLRVGFPLLHWVGAKINRLDPDGKTMYVDLSGMTIKGATNSVWADNRSLATTAYITG